MIRELTAVSTRTLETLRDPILRGTFYFVSVAPGYLLIRIAGLKSTYHTSASLSLLHVAKTTGVSLSS